MEYKDLEKVASQLLKAVRGKKSQQLLSKRLGYSFNRIYRLESNSSSVYWIDFVSVCESCKVDLKKIIRDEFYFFGSIYNTGELLRHLIGEKGADELADLFSCSVFRISRLFSNKTKLTLVEVLLVIDRFRFVMVPFLKYFLSEKDIEKLAANTVRQNEIDLNAENPLAGAVKAAIVVNDKLTTVAQQVSFVSRLLNVPQTDIAALFVELEQAKVFVKKNLRYVLGSQQNVDTRGDFSKTAKIKQFWLERASGRLAQMKNADERNFFSYLVFACSNESMEKIKELYYKFFRETVNILENDGQSPENLRALQVQFFDP